MYNVKIKRFMNTEELTVYPQGIEENRNSIDLAYEWGKYNPSTGEIYPLNVNTHIDDKRFVNPFTGDYDYFRYLRENEDASLRRSTRRSKNKIKEIAYSNNWEYFFTLTFDPQKVDSYDYDMVTSKLSKWLQNQRSKNKNMKYMVVPELHESGRYHFHGLFANCENLRLVDSGHKQKEDIVYNVQSFRLGFSTATKIKDTEKASTYISKYICKDIVQSTYNKRRYWYSKNCDLPQIEKYDVDRELLQNINCILGDEYTERIVEHDGKCYKYYRCPIYTTNTDGLKQTQRESADLD